LLDPVAGGEAPSPPVLSSEPLGEPDEEPVWGGAGTLESPGAGEDADGGAATGTLAMGGEAPPPLSEPLEEPDEGPASGGAGTAALLESPGADGTALPLGGREDLDGGAEAVLFDAAKVVAGVVAGTLATGLLDEAGGLALEGTTTALLEAGWEGGGADESPQNVIRRLTLSS